MRRALLAVLLLSSVAYAMETGRFGPVNSNGSTLTIAAVGGAGTGGVLDRNCLTALSVSAGSGYGAQSSAICVFQVTSAGSTLWSIAISTTSPTPVVESWTASSTGGSNGYGMCGAPGQTLVVNATNCGSAYQINAQGYIDR